jgi:putative Mg2+ transporter-C (MgtC) family protein
VISYVVSGIGFLGAGVIMKEGTHVRGLNTAATLWASAAVDASPVRANRRSRPRGGVCAGGQYAASSAGRFRQPPPDGARRDRSALSRACRVSGERGVARDLLFDELETHHYPIREMETLAEAIRRLNWRQS